MAWIAAEVPFQRLPQTLARCKLHLFHLLCPLPLKTIIPVRAPLSLPFLRSESCLTLPDL